MPNAGFEQLVECPEEIGELTKAVPWKSLNTGTPEYFNRECPFSESTAHSGNGHAGIISYCDYETIAIEYLTVKLARQLDSGLYCAGFWVKAKKSPYYIADNSMLVHEGKIKLRYWGAYYAQPQISTDSIIEPNQDWVLIFSKFNTAGGEDHISIGNFTKPHQMHKIAGRGTGINTYYYIDDVFLYKLNEGDRCAFNDQLVEPKPKPVPKPEPDLISVYFDFDRSVLSDEMKTKLGKTTQEYATSQVLKIHLTGHTDSLGTDDYNLKLAQERAESVKSFLLNLDLPAEVFTLDSRGESKAKFPNRTERGRSKNRRVDIEIVSE